MVAFNTVQASWLSKPYRALLLATPLVLLALLALSYDWSSYSDLQYQPETAKVVHESAPQESHHRDGPVKTFLSFITPANQTATPAKPAPPAWKWDANRDRNRHSLDAAQCDTTFPDLYCEIDRAAKYWKARTHHGKLEKSQYSLDWSKDGGLTVMIHNQQLYITYSRGLNNFLHWEERSKSALLNINRAIETSPEPIPNMEFSIKINDRIELDDTHPNHTVWAFSRNISDAAMEQVWLMPDFNFWAYPRVAGSYGDFQRQALEMDDFESKIDKLVWRGTTAFNPPIRDALLKQTKGRPWADVLRVKEDSNDEESLRNYITIPDHCKYKYTIHTEGWSWSGRLKYLWSCHSVIFIHKLTHHTHLYHLLDPSGPKQNYVFVEKNFTDLEPKMQALMLDQKEAKRIADNSAETFRDRYVTPAAQTCYWRRLFEVWASMTEEPEPVERSLGNDGMMVEKWKGMTFEEYLFYKEDFPPQVNKTKVRNGL